jgi:hypothetical protein
MSSHTEHADKVFVRVDENVFATMEKTVINFDQVNIDAKHGTKYELEMTVWEAIKAYPRATFFSFMLSLSLIMEGYGMHLAYAGKVADASRHLFAGLVLRLPYLPTEVR